MSELSVLGGGGHSLVVAEAADCAGWRLLGVYDDSTQPVACIRGGLSLLGPLLAAFKGARLLTVGSVAARRRVLDALGELDDDEWATIVHPRALISRSCRIDPGGFIGANAVVQASATLGRHAIINTGAIVEHECQLGENVHIAPGAILAGNVTVGSDTLVGIGARVLPGMTIGEGCTIGAGAVVVHHVPDGATVVGVPARTLRSGASRA